MQTSKRILALLLALCLIAGVVPASAVQAAAENIAAVWEEATAQPMSASGTCGDNLTWTLDDEGVLTISGTGPMTDYGSASSVPWYSSKSAIKTAIIEDGVTTIGTYAFRWCTSLTSVTIGNSVTSIGSSAFDSCTSLTSVTIPDSVTSIGGSAFDCCESLINVIIPDSVTYLGSGAFSNCNNLTEVSIPSGITSILSYTFAYCSSLTEVTIPELVTNIGPSAFSGCKFSAIEIPVGVITIGRSAFSNCDYLTEVNIPDSVTSIGSGAFSFCDNLLSINVGTGNTKYSSDSYGALYNKKKTIILGVPGSTQEYNIPSSVTSIAEGAFGGCSKLSSIIIPGSVSSIGERAFYGCDHLSSISIPNSVTTIGDEAFRYCGSLEQIVISDNITSINWGTFADCYSLTSVNIPGSVAIVDDAAFYYCINLSYIGIPKSVVSIGYSAFGACEKLSDVYYSGSAEAWSAVSIGSNNTYLTNATIHYNSSGPGDGETEEPGEDGEATTSIKVVYLSSWDEENQVVYFGRDIQSMAEVTENTDASFLDELDSLLGKYVLVELNEQDGTDELITIKPVESQIGTVDYVSGILASITIDGTEYTASMEVLSDVAVGDDILYHIYEDEIVAIEVLKIQMGELMGWDSETREVSITLDDEPDLGAVSYALSDLADEPTLELLNMLSSGDTTLAVSIRFICDEQGFIYIVTERGTLASGKCGENLTWKLDEAGTLTISGTGDMYDYSSDEDCLASWNKYADKVKNIVLSDGVTSIGQYAFYQLASITTVTIPASVSAINDGAFFGCTNLQANYYGGSVEQWKQVKFGEFIGPLFSSTGDGAAIFYNGCTKLDVWAFGNSNSSFGIGSEGYYITHEDYNKLTDSLSRVDKNYVSYAEVTFSGLLGKGDLRFNIDGTSTESHAEWKGSCHGMSTWVFLNYYNSLMSATIGGLDTLGQYDTPVDNTYVESAINFYQGQQYISQYQEMVKTFISRGQDSQLEYLDECGRLMDASDKILFIEFEWSSSGNEADGEDSTKNGHAVIGYAWEEIDPVVIEVKGTAYTYDTRILIYDCAVPDQYYYDSFYDANLYYNLDEGIWCIPGWNIVSTNINIDDVGNNGRLKLITDSDSINLVDYGTGEKSTSQVNFNISVDSMLTTSANAEYTLYSGDERAFISGTSVEGNADVISTVDVNITAEGLCYETTATAFLPDGVDSYTVESGEPMSFVFRNDNYYTGAALSASGSMTFEQNGMVSITSDESTAYYLDLVANDGYCDLPWYKVEISGSDVTEASTKKTEDGILIYCDNMDSITIAVTDDEGTTETTTSSEGEAILISQNDGELAVLEDADGDGIYETDITVPEAVKFPEHEAVALDFGKIPEDFANEMEIDLEPMLCSNMYFTEVSWGYNSNTEIIYLSSGILRLAVYWKQHLYINDYSVDYQLLESLDIPLDVSGWGGICLGEESSFVFYGQASTEDDSVVYLVTEYDADFNEVATISLNECTTESLELFGFSNVAMGLRDHTLSIFTTRNNSSSYSNYYACAIEIDVEKMGDSDASAAVTFLGRVSMGSIIPYRNILGFDGNEPIYAVVSSDGYPGGIYISAANSVSHLKPDTALGDNEYDDDLIITNATNMAVSSSHYLIASVFENYGINNIYLAVQEKATGNISGRFLTNATAFNSEINSTPWIVDLGNDQFALLWERIELGSVNVCSVLLDASGTPMGQVQTWRGCSLSAMVPIYANDRILWVTAENGEMELYQLQDLDASGYQEVDNGIVEGDTVWDGTSDSSWYQESETCFSISTAEQLAGLADLVNAGNDFSGKTIRLENDLFMNSSPFGHIEDNQWVPIGASEDGSAVFNGFFDGQCHTVYNMVVPADGLTGGLFGTIGADGTVKCLTLEQGWFGNSACVADTNYGEVLFCMTKSYVEALPDDPRGGVCRYNYGLIYGCQNYGFIENSSECGGIVYRNEQGGTVSQCANKGLLYTILNTLTRTGTSGVAYYNYGWIYNCYNLGVARNGSKRSAGIVGYTNGYIGCGQVYNCYSLSGYPLQDPIYISKGVSAEVENCFGNTEPGAEWYEEFCKTEFLTKLDEQLGPMASAWLPDTLGINDGLPITVAEYNYHTGNYKVQPELWGVSPSKTVLLSDVDTISLSRVEYYFSDAALEITSDNVDVADIVDGKIQLYHTGSATILFHLDETEESTALDYTMTITVTDHNYGEWNEIIAATCSTAGEERRDCLNCDAFEIREIPALGHNYVATVTSPSCTEKGYTTHTCSACGDSYVDDHTDALGHDWQGASCSRCGAWNNPFVDVTEDAYYYTPVMWAIENGITSGTTATTFSPYDVVERCQMVTFLWRAAGCPEPTSDVNPFTDVNESHYFYKAVLWAVEKGITSGTTATTFSPFDKCERCQVITFLYRAMGKPEVTSSANPFTDVSEANYFYNAVLWAVEKGITTGSTATTFSPFNLTERCQAVTFLYRAYN